MKGVNIGEGSKVYTVIYREKKATELVRCTAYGSPDQAKAWKQTCEKFSNVVALIPGNHPAILRDPSS